jgi:low temperature requirement protein LtrA
VIELGPPREHPVAPLELFFDLVFVFAFTQVTTLLSADPTWWGLVHALLILTALWWAWASYSWLTNTVDPENGAVWSAVLLAMASMFVAALALPDAFSAHGVLFGVAFLIVNVMLLALYALGARGDRDLLAAVLRLAPAVLAGSLLILAAGFASEALRPLLWLAALVVGIFGSALLGGVSGWRVQPAHFVERHGLIIIIAIGESLVAIGLGARGTALGAAVVGAAVLGFVVATSFWLTYFDFFPTRGRQLLADRSGAERVALARDVYTYLHLPMVVGIVLFAFAVKSTIAHVHQELGTVAAVSLCAGPALYLLSFVAVRFRVTRRFGHGRPLAAIACALLTPVALAIPALAALGLVTAVWVILHTYELVWLREARMLARAERSPAPSP